MLNWPQSVITALFVWLVYLFRPYAAIGDIFEQKLQDSPSAIVGKFWFIPIALTLSTDFVVLRFFGADFANYWPLTLLYLAFVSLKLVFEAFVLFAVLHLMKVDVSPGMSFVCFTLIVIYTPLFSWIGIPQAVHMYDLVALLKSQHLNFADTITYFVAHATEINKKIAYSAPTVVLYINACGVVIYLISTTLVAEALSQMLDVGIRKAYVITAVATTLNYVPAILIGLFQIALAFASLSPQTP